MVMHIGSGFEAGGSAGRQLLEPVDFNEPPRAAPVPPPPPPPPPPAPLPSPAAPTLQSLPNAPFGPPSPYPGNAPHPSVLADLPSPPAVAVTLIAVAAAAPSPAGPTATPLEIATLELTLADPLNQALINAHGGLPLVLGSGESAQAQVSHYGADLAGRLGQLALANNAVRNTYLHAMDEAAQNVGPGTAGAVFVPGISGGTDSQDPVPDSWRFDPVAFTESYAQGDSLEQRAFAALHGPSALVHEGRWGGGDAEFYSEDWTLAGSFSLKPPLRADLGGEAGGSQYVWQSASLQSGVNGLVQVNPNAPPALYQAGAVWFDATAGWVTPQTNLVQRRDFLDKAIPVAFVSVMTWATAGAFGIAGGAGVVAGAGASLASVAAASAAFGAISGFYSGIVNDGRIDLKGMVRGALTAAAAAGFGQAAGLNTLGLRPDGTVASYAQRALAITGQATLQGALSEIAGGRFQDGFTAAMAQGLGNEVARGLNQQINVLESGSPGVAPIDAAQAGTLRHLARAAQSAVSLLARPDDPGHAFAMTFVNGLVADVQQGLDNRDSQGLNGTWAGIEDQSAAETARLARQNDVPAGSFWGSDPALSLYSLWSDAHAEGATANGLRLSPASAAEFQASLQAGIDSAADNPSLDPAVHLRLRLQQLLAEPLSGATSGPWEATGADDGDILLAGLGGPRPPAAGTAGQGLQVNLNQRANTVFDALSNAPVGDALGIIPEAYRDIKLLGPMIQEGRLHSEIERMRTALGQSGLDVTPERLGAIPGIDASGRVTFNLPDLADRYANAMRLLELRRQGVIELDISNFSVVSVGSGRIRPQELLQNVKDRYQAEFSRALDEAQKRLSLNQTLRYPIDMPQQLQIGLFADLQAKNAVANYLRSIDVPEGPGQIVALNRWAYDAQGSGFYVRPDVLLDFGPNSRHWIDGKSSYINEGVLPRQLTSFFEYTGSQTGTISTRGGSVELRAPARLPRRP